MASRYLLDTSALIAHSRQEPGWPRVQSLFEENDSEILACSVSLTEFARRLRELGATSEEARSAVEDYLELLDEVVPVDGVVAFLAFDIGCAMEKRLPLTDALIAAAAHRAAPAWAIEISIWCPYLPTWSSRNPMESISPRPRLLLPKLPPPVPPRGAAIRLESGADARTLRTRKPSPGAR